MFTQDNLLFDPLVINPPEATGHELVELAQTSASQSSPVRPRQLVFARCFYTSGDSQIESRFAKMRREVLLDESIRNSLIKELSQIDRSNAENQHSLFEVAERALEMTERSAAIVYLTHYPDLPQDFESDSVSSVLRQAKSREMIAVELADQLIEAVQLCRNLLGMRQLVLEHGVSAQASSEHVRNKLAQACNYADFNDLTEAIEGAVTVAENGFAQLTAH